MSLPSVPPSFPTPHPTEPSDKPATTSLPLARAHHLADHLLDAEGHLQDASLARALASVPDRNSETKYLRRMLLALQSNIALRSALQSIELPAATPRSAQVTLLSALLTRPRQGRDLACCATSLIIQQLHNNPQQSLQSLAHILAHGEVTGSPIPPTGEHQTMTAVDSYLLHPLVEAWRNKLLQMSGQTTPDLERLLRQHFARPIQSRRIDTADLRTMAGQLLELAPHYREQSHYALRVPDHHAFSFLPQHASLTGRADIDAETHQAHTAWSQTAFPSAEIPKLIDELIHNFTPPYYEASVRATCKNIPKQLSYVQIRHELLTRLLPGSCSPQKMRYWIDQYLLKISSQYHPELLQRFALLFADSNWSYRGEDLLIGILPHPSTGELSLVALCEEGAGALLLAPEEWLAQPWQLLAPAEECADGRR